MGETATRVLFAILLLLIGMTLVMFYGKTMTAESGREIAIIGRYLSSKFHLAPLIGGLGMMVVASFVLITARKNASCGHDHDHGESCDEEHEHGDLNPLVALLIVCLPLGVAVANTQHELSDEGKSTLSEANPDPRSYVESGYSLPKFTRETLDEYKTKNANGSYEMEVLELFQTAGDPEVSKVLTGLPIVVSGAVRTQPGQKDNPKVRRMYRMVMSCCAADMQAIPLKLILSDELAKSFNYSDHTWMNIEGKLGYETDDQGIKKTVIHVEKAERGVPPDNEVMQAGMKSPDEQKL